METTDKIVKEFEKKYLDEVIGQSPFSIKAARKKEIEMALHSLGKKLLEVEL